MRCIHTKILLLLILVLGTGRNSIAQISGNEINNPDSLFSIARGSAFEGDFENCRGLCFKVLGSFPEYHDFTVLAARTLAWEQQSDSASTLLLPLLERRPPVKEASILQTDIQIWKEDYGNAMLELDIALLFYPSDSTLLHKKAFVQSRLNPDTNIVSEHPHPNLLAPDSNAVGIIYYFEHFTQPYIARRHMLSLQYRKVTEFAPMSFQMNLGDYVFNNEQLANDPSIQFEAEIYPQINRKSYLYFNYAIGQRYFFPLHRFGGEYFTGIGNDFELSGGIRYMYWDESILFLTGSIAKYLGTFWFNFRPFFALAGKNFANSYVFEARKFLKPVNSYLYTQIVAGTSPDQPLFLAEEYGNFNNYQLRAGYNYRFKNILTGAALGYQYDEYFSDQFRNRFDLSLNVFYVF